MRSKRTALAAMAGLVAVTAIGATLAFAPGFTERVYTARLADEELARYRMLDAVTSDRHAALLSDATGPCRRNFDLVTQEAMDTLLRCTEGGAPEEMGRPGQVPRALFTRAVRF